MFTFPLNVTTGAYSPVISEQNDLEHNRRIVSATTVTVTGNPGYGIVSHCKLPPPKRWTWILLATYSGANLMLWDYWGGGNQQFRFQSACNRKWRISNRNSELCLDAAGISTANGVNLLQWQCIMGNNNQIFELIRQQITGNFTEK